MLGIGLLFPWNAILASAGTFFRNKFEDDDVGLKMTVAFMVPNLVALLGLLAGGSRVPLRARLGFGYGTYVVLMASLPLLPSLWMVLTVVCLLGGLDAVVQGSVFSLGAMTGPLLTDAVMSGVGIAGLSVTLLYMAALGGGGGSGEGGGGSGEGGRDEDRTTAALFFGSSTLVLLACVAISLWIVPVALRIRRVAGLGSGDGVDGVDDGDGVDGVDDGVDDVRVEDAGRVGLVTMGPVMSAGGPRGVRWGMGVWKGTRFHALLVFANFALTLLLFPRTTTQIPSTHASLNPCPLPPEPCPPGTGDATIPFSVWLTLVFMVGDFVGRSLPGWMQASHSIPDRYLGPCIASRLIFVPLFLLMYSPRLIASDALAITTMALFSVSSGYLGSLCMSRGPSGVEGVEEKELAGIVMVASLTSGLALGVTLSLIFAELGLL